MLPHVSDRAPFDTLANIRAGHEPSGSSGTARRKPILRAMRRLGALAVLVATSGANAAAAATTTLDAIRQRGVLRVAVLDEFPWLKERHGGGEPCEGAAWVIAKQAARRLHVRLVTVRVSFDDKLRVLDDGRVDATIAPLLATPERTQRYGVVVYSQAAQCLFGRADDPKLREARSLDDLDRRDITIAVVSGAPQGQWLRKRLGLGYAKEGPYRCTSIGAPMVCYDANNLVFGRAIAKLHRRERADGLVVWAKLGYDPTGDRRQLKRRSRRKGSSTDLRSAAS